MVCDAINENETACVAVFRVRIETDGLVQLQLAYSNLIEFEFFSGNTLEGIHVDAVFYWRDRRWYGLRPNLHQVRTAAQHRLITHPDDCGFKLARDFGGDIRRGNQIASGNIQFIRESEGNGLSRRRLFEITVVGDDARDTAFPSRRLYSNAFTCLNNTACDSSAEPAEIHRRPIHPLHRKPERQFLQPLFINFHRLEPAHESRAAVPRSSGACYEDVIAL